MTESLSRSMPVTVRRRKPGQAGGGLALTRPALPPPGSRPAVHERSLPARAQRRDAQRAEQLLTRVAGQVEERVGLGYRHLLVAGGDLEDRVACLDVAFFEHAEIEARAMVGDEQRGDARVVHPDADAVAGDPRLRDLEERGPDAVTVADADLVVVQSVDGEVLAELPVDEVVALELALPIAVRVDLVDEDGALLAAVSRDVALSVAVDVELAHAARTGDGILEDAREDGLSLPCDVLGHADIDGQQGAHAFRFRSAVQH